MNIKDYLKYYIGCPAVNSWFPKNHQEYNKGWVLTAIQLNLHNPYKLETKEEATWTNSVKPILRRIESVTVDEKLQIADLSKQFRPENHVLPATVISKRWAAEQTHYLLSLGIDLFGLIEAGLAVDADTVNQQKQK